MDVHQVAEAFGIPEQYQTIADWAKGKLTTAQFNTDCQKLKPMEESILEDFIIQSAECGIPLIWQQIAEHTNLILQNQMGGKFVPVRDSWMGRFLEWHRDILQTHWSKSLDTQRA